jgi:hypothetical protein
MNTVKTDLIYVFGFREVTSDDKPSRAERMPLITKTRMGEIV